MWCLLWPAVLKSEAQDWQLLQKKLKQQELLYKDTVYNFDLCFPPRRSIQPIGAASCEESWERGLKLSPSILHVFFGQIVIELNHEELSCKSLRSVCGAVGKD